MLRLPTQACAESAGARAHTCAQNNKPVCKCLKQWHSVINCVIVNNKPYIRLWQIKINNCIRINNNNNNNICICVQTAGCLATVG